MSVAKPADLVLWVPGDEAAKMTSPSSAKRILGWESDEKPAFQTMNYLQNNWGKWGQYVNQMPPFNYDSTSKDFGWGDGALDNTSSAISASNVALGVNAGENVDTAVSVYIGLSAGQKTTPAVTGSGNICIGNQAGLESEGIEQMFMGGGAGARNTNNFTIGLGTLAGSGSAATPVHGTKSIFIGYQVGLDASLGTDSVVWIGNSSSATPLIQGNFTNSLLVINGSIQSTGYIAVEDGMTAPGTVSGKALIYVDTADGDLKVKFGDGTVKTLATDT